MIIEIDKEFRDSFICCDVSWISIFRDECEILIAQSLGYNLANKFSLKVMDQTNGIQTPSMNESISQKNGLKPS